MKVSRPAAHVVGRPARRGRARRSASRPCAGGRSCPRPCRRRPRRGRTRRSRRRTPGRHSPMPIMAMRIGVRSFSAARLRRSAPASPAAGLQVRAAAATATFASRKPSLSPQSKRRPAKRSPWNGCAADQLAPCASVSWISPPAPVSCASRWSNTSGMQDVAADHAPGVEGASSGLGFSTSPRDLGQAVRSRPSPRRCRSAWCARAAPP